MFGNWIISNVRRKAETKVKRDQLYPAHLGLMIYTFSKFNPLQPNCKRKQLENQKIWAICDWVCCEIWPILSRSNATFTTDKHIYIRI